MSRNVFNRNSRVQDTKSQKPFCKVCQDAGKSVEEYTSHFVKDKEGKVVCQTLLQQQCRYCFQPGHTVKFCEVLKKRDNVKDSTRKNRIKVAEEKKHATATVTVTAPRSDNGFAALADDSDEDESANGTSIGATRQAMHQATREDDFPALSSNVTLRPKQKHFQEESKVSFAEKLKEQPKATVEPIPFLKTKKSVQVVAPIDAWSDDEAQVQLQVQVKPQPAFRTASKMNWADCSSSDEEDD
jgi:hypothetical protein